MLKCNVIVCYLPWFSSPCSLIVCSPPGIIKHGGVKPNIIPDYTELEFYLRTPLFKDLDVLKAKAEACFRSAAMATGCQVSMRKIAYFLSLPSDLLLSFIV